MKQGLVSIIIPVYNVEKYLDRCIESVTKQSYQNLEIILVDDGSPDKCPQMCEAWAKRDDRIQVIHKENQGLSQARNTGILNATGEYLCFLDSDDYIDLETIQKAVDMAQKENTDIVIFGMGFVNDQECVFGEEIPETPKTVYEGREVQEVLLPEALGKNRKTGRSFKIMFSACCVLFSAELIQRSQWRFVSEREILSEDVYSLLMLYKDIRKVGIIKERLYYYCENSSSVSRTYRPDRQKRNKHFYLQCVELCEKCGYVEEVKIRCNHSFLCNSFAAMKQAVAYFGGYRRAKKALEEIINEAVFQQVLKEKRKDKETFNKTVFFWAARNRLYYICYLLLAIKLNG